MVQRISCIARPMPSRILPDIESTLTSVTLPLKKLIADAAEKLGASSGEWKTFLPMAALFFTMAFINTIVNSLSTSLVITAPGGGAGVIPFLTAYVAFPLTLGATVLYAYASHFISHKRLFTITVGIFAACNLLFALCLFPNHNTLHLPGVADALAKVLPSGLSGAVGMVRNWTFSIFYCLSEMWGDMGISLLFWGFANEITSSKQAHIVYPMLGIGANVAQTLGGIVVKMSTVAGAAAYTSRSQTLLFQIVGCMVVAMGIHHFIASQTEKKQAEVSENKKLVEVSENKKLVEVSSFIPETISAEKSSEKLLASVGTQSNESSWVSQNPGHVFGVCESFRSKSLVSRREGTSYEIFPQKGHVLATIFRKPERPIEALAKTPLINLPGPISPSTLKKQRDQETEVKKEHPSFMESVKTLKDSLVVKNLGIITIAQALSVTLLEFMWRSQLKLVCPTPAAFQAVMGDIATATGLFTGGMMFLSPILFSRIGWKGVANLMPAIMTLGGCAFFALCSAFHVFGQLGMPALAQQILPITAIGGSVLYVLSRGSKFSLFKPSQEMVYIKMDKAQRTKGKAAVDVVGANVGKSGGSLLQQVLLLASGGHLLLITPVMFAVYTCMMQGWNRAVHSLAPFQEETTKCSDADQLPSRPLDLSELDEEEENLSMAAGAGSEHHESISSVDDGEANSAVEFVNHSSPSSTSTARRVLSHPVTV